MAITSLDLALNKIDLSDVLSWRIAHSPKFVQLFSAPASANANGGGGGGAVATSTEHKWLEGQETPKTKAFSAFTFVEGNNTFTVESSAGWQVGDLFHILGDSAVLRVKSVTPTTIIPELVASNGSNSPLATWGGSNGGTLIFDSRPIQEGSTEGEDMFLQTQIESNFTQIFRADVSLTGTATAVEQYGAENDVTKQIEYATDAIIRRMNSALLFGARVQRTATNPGSLGGLYHYGCQADGISLAQSYNPALTIGMLNQAAQLVTEAGGIPDLILCNTGQGQVISTFMKSQVQIAQNDPSVGRYVTQFVTSAGGNVLRVFVDPAVPDTDVWVCDSRGFALLPLAGRALHTEPATTPGTDGVRAMILGEYTAEFKNAKQSLCRISGLKASAATLAAN